MSEEQKIIHEHRNIENPPDLKIEITRGQRGGYGWTITYSGKNLADILDRIQFADTLLRGSYGAVDEK
jgi:hypothetical protein